MRAIIAGFAVVLTTASLSLCCGVNAARAADEVVPPSQDWSFQGAFGTFDRGAAQRGYQVYKEVCSSCHSLNLVAYRDLTALGFSKAEVKALAAQVTFPTTNHSGDPAERPGTPSDYFKAPFINKKQARAANGGALPPDLSLIVKARAFGPDYIYGILTGFKDAPAGFKLTEGKAYNEYFPGHQIAMAQPLSDNFVTYSDGTKATLPQEAHDVVTFLTWAAEPKLEDRHRTGVKVMGFLALFTIFTYLSYRKIRKRVRGH